MSMSHPILLSTDPSELLAFEQALGCVHACKSVSLLGEEKLPENAPVFVGTGHLKQDLSGLVASLAAAAPGAKLIALLAEEDGCDPEAIAAAGFHAMLPLPVHGPLLRFLAQGGSLGRDHDTAKGQLVDELRGSWDRGELCLHYQPRCAAETRLPRGFEALVRWQHPTRGLLSPAEFIPLAEESGLIIELGAWVLKEACAQMAAWDQAGLMQTQVAVNLSALQFSGAGPYQVVQEALLASGLDARRLELEITESLMMEDPEKVIVELERLKALGVHLSIDDFGTGYSSLSYLRRFPVDTLKIDKCFVDNLTVDPGDAAIVTSIVVLAQSLNLSLVAEGVEDERQFEFLRILGVDEIQGYLLSKPLLAGDVPSYLCAFQAAKDEEQTKSVEPVDHGFLQAEHTG